MPIPMMANRSFFPDAAVSCAAPSRGSNRIAPAAAEPARKNCLREEFEFMTWNPPNLLFQRLDGHFLEIHDVVVAVILQSDVAENRTASALRFVIQFLRRHRIAFLIIGDLDAI